MTSTALIIPLAHASLALFFLISGFHIHWARVTHWRDFTANFDRLAHGQFGQVTRPTSQYIIAAPFVAAFVAGTVGLILGENWGRWPWTIGSVGITLMDLAGWQTVVWRGLWADLATKLGFAVGGALALLLFAR